MRNRLLIIFILAAVPASATGIEYEKCMKEEHVLRKDAENKCSGMSYLFNPSDCIKARKKLADYDGSKCGNPPKAVSKHAAPVERSPEKKDNEKRPAEQEKPAAKEVEQLSASEKLQRDVMSLKEELKLLRSEVEQLKHSLPKTR